MIILGIIFIGAMVAITTAGEHMKGDGWDE